jgi:hypothetical protein
MARMISRTSWKNTSRSRRIFSKKGFYPSHAIFVSDGFTAPSWCSLAS